MDNLLIADTAANILKKVVATLPHALILSGPSGVGVATVARAIAKQVGSPLLVITPKKKLQGGAKIIEDSENGSIIIEDIRALYSQTRSKFTSPQVIIIDFANRPMTIQAQNAFLKLLEEPQQNVHFIIATHHPEQLLPTVVSRSQTLWLPPVDAQKTSALLEKLGITDPVKKARLTFAASGLPAEITRLATNSTYYDARVKTIQDARKLLEGDVYQRLIIVKSYKDNRAQAITLINDMLVQLRAALKQIPDQRIVAQLNSLLETHAKVTGGGNIQLQLAKVLL